MDSQLPSISPQSKSAQGSDFGSEREIMYKILFDMKNDLNDLKALTSELIKNRGNHHFSNQEKDLISRVYASENQNLSPNSLLYFENPPVGNHSPTTIVNQDDYDDDMILDIDLEEPEKGNTLSLMNNEKELIIKALEKHNGRRNKAAEELGISQRTLYRKIKQYNLED